MPNTNWRDLTPELTAKQITSLEHAEANAPTAGAAEAQESLLGFAHDYAALNRATAALDGLPVPPGATADSWAVRTAGGFCRTLEWGQPFGTIQGVDVLIDGTQYDNGDFARSVTVYSSDQVRLSAVEARELAGALLAAAEEFDRLNGDA